MTNRLTLENGKEAALQSASEAMRDVAGDPVAGRSLWEDARRRLGRNKAAMACLYILGFILICALFVPFIWPWEFDAIDKNATAIGPTLTDWHWLGTDSQGRDMVIRLLIGLRISLAVGIIATCVSMIIGVSYGAIAGYMGGRVDMVMMRVVDVMYSLPFIFFVILLIVMVGPYTKGNPVANILCIFLALGAVQWLTMARIVRGQTLALKNMEFVEAARAGGVKPMTIIFRHIVPNLIGTVVIYATLTIPGVILQESFLSFLGLGVQEPLTSLGKLIKNGADYMDTSPWLLIFPALIMILTLFCFNFVGDGLRDALDPKDR